MPHTNLFLSFLLLFVTQPYCQILTLAADVRGQWKLLQKSIGISAMHMQLLNNDHVIMFDRTDFGYSNLSLPKGKCRYDPGEEVHKIDCTAHSIEYDVLTNKFRPLMVQTDVWCSAGAAMPNGTLIQTGGYRDGAFRVRIFTPCNSTIGCDWVEVPNGLKMSRWYATNHILPDGRQIIIGGRRHFNYEFYPKNNAPEAYSFPFLLQTYDPYIENNLYPFVFLNVDGNLFIFANNRAILFDYKQKKVVKTYPTIPGGEPRNYPSTGSAVLLPLMLQAGTNNIVAAEVLVCGGAPKGSFMQAKTGNHVKALDTCGRIVITDENPQWSMETMPQGRVMNDMILLPNGNVLIINGAKAGTAGWEYGRNPASKPILYQPNNPRGSRFELQNPSTIPRMYHSTAILVRDGRVLVGGSNPHRFYNFTGVLFPTELSLEAFHPSYLEAQFDNLRPKIIWPDATSNIGYGQKLWLRFRVIGTLAEDKVSVTMVAPPFNTHSFSMNQRLLLLGIEKVTNVDTWTYDIQVKTPFSGNLAPSGYYMLFVVHQEIPSEGIWVKLM
ncbi:unnamed protein product [Dovyalis caffra]|uniref:Aldehyde oxidase GLOX n=1 Tax=Dovyalis caffra TaxID=77055 RepID=A0AAV1QMR9_9ROSI|nr:unnamed protein product [Dovyalis caffra]